MFVGRDCFARGEYKRVSMGAGTCQWCGQKRKRTYAYLWERDDTPLGNYESRGSKHFCNFVCFKVYYS